MTDAQLTYTVQVDVSGSAFGSAFAATDVSSKAVAGLSFEPITVAWGRQDQHSDVTPTTVAGALLNTDGTFSPGNSSSTYFPHIRRLLRRRVKVGVNATTVAVSEDYAASIEVVPAHDTPAVTNVEGSDILARFGQSTSAQDANALSIGTTLRTFLAEEMMVDNPTCLYMLQEAEGATSFADVTGTLGPAVVVNSKHGAGVVDAGQTDAGTFYGGTFVNITNSSYSTWTSSVAQTTGSWLAFTGPDLSGTQTYTYEIWVSTSTAPPAQLAAILTATKVAIGGGGDVQIELNSSGHVIAISNGTAVIGTRNICDGLVHQIAVIRNGTTLAVYVDGALDNSGPVVAQGGPLSVFTLGMDANTPGIIAPFTGGLAHFAVYPSALSSTRVAAHYQAGATAFAGERTDQRITRLLSYRANTGSVLDTGLGTMGLQDIAGRTLQDCLFEVGQVEAGAVFVDGLGQVNFRSRSRLFNPTPTVTLDMSVGGVDFGSNWREDTQNVLDDVTITNSTTGSAQRNFSASTIGTDGEFSTSVSLPLNSDQDAANMAGWMVANGTQQQLTATPLIINLLHLTAAQAQAVLQLQPLDCLRLTNCPTPAPSATQTYIVQGGTISLAADAATATLNVTPLPYPVGVWDTTVWDAAGVTWAF